MQNPMPVNILDKIIALKRQEVQKRKALYPVALLEESIYFQAPTVSLSKYLQRLDKSGIIAEFKRRSPSKGNINLYASVEKVSIGYMQAGASALSVLTDEQFFGGQNADLSTARKFNFCPILRKDFVIDEYQIIEARSIGADAVLLIAECLDKQKLAGLARLARQLGMEVLMEVHSAGQLDKLSADVNLVGVNNRNLKDFSVSMDTSLKIASSIPADVLKISESGINNPQSIVELKQAGFQGFLIGEYFMSSADPASSCAEFVQAIQKLQGKLLPKNEQ